VHGLNRHGNIPIGRNQDDRKIRIVFFNPLHQLDAIHTGHSYIGHDDPGKTMFGGFADNLLDGLLAVRAGMDIVPEMLQLLPQQIQGKRIVIDNQDF
jgi:hypothetical protein